MERAGSSRAKQSALPLEVAGTELRRAGAYTLEAEKPPRRSSEALVALYADLVRRHPILSIEDGLAEDDWEGWALLTRSIGGAVQLVGDDIFVTNVAILEEGIKKKGANAILIKPNQIGTLTET